MADLFLRKPMDHLLRAAEGLTLKRTLGPFDLVALGIGAIIGAGLFVRTAAAIADCAGPSVTIAFALAGVGCAFAGLCYAEFASMIPIAGSAYTYAYATMGELVAWIIGWDLVLEYAIGAATVAIAWSQYFNRLLGYLHIQIPFAWCHAPSESMVDAAGQTVHGIMNVPALGILLLLTAVLIRGTQESALLNSIIVVTKVAIVLMVIGFGWHYINPQNHEPYIPPPTTYVDAAQVSHSYGGFWGIVNAAGVVFFAFIGFDAVSTTAQEAKKPKRDMPIGILGSLVICTALYILFAHVLSGIATVDDFRHQGREASVAYAISTYMHGYEWLSKLVTIAILAGFSSVMLVMLLGQSRVFYSMSHDGLVSPLFSELHPRYRTPYKSNAAFFVLTASFAAFVPEEIVGDMTSIGTLFAFILVSAGVWIMRVKNPDAQRAFRVPAAPVVAVLGVITNGLMIYGLGWTNWARLGVWLAIGLVIYFTYGIRHSKLRKELAG
jgi:basic amino acid/polyamine antiporter, APA family